MPLEKIPAILLIVLGMHIALTAPTPPTPKSQRRFGDGPVGINWLGGGINLIKANTIATSQIQLKQLTSIKAGYWTCAVAELCIIVAGTMESDSAWSKRVVALLLPSGKHPYCIRLTPTTTLATILVVSGAVIRYWCFREMGRHFTFHITILENHKLVMTGPYSIVRHPSYAGTILMAVGQVIWYTAPGSWLREGMIYQIKLAWLLIIPVILCMFLGLANTPRRMMAEDAMLKKEFGKEWDKWAKAVPYRLFPGIH